MDDLWAGAWAAREPAFYWRTLALARAGNLVFDVGAHVGDRVGSFRRLGARVVAVEPQPALTRTLRILYGLDRQVTIEPAAIETALMTVEGELDDISGVGQTKAAHTLTPNIPGARRAHWEQPRVGHYGIFNGRKWREQIMPRVADFIRANEAR